MTTYKSKSFGLLATVVTWFLLTASFLPCIFAEQLPSVTRELQDPGGPQTIEPTSNSTTVPTDEPTLSVTESPTPQVTVPGTEASTEAPTRPPTKKPTRAPTREPTPFPTAAPVTPDPTPSGTLEPTLSPSASPTSTPTTASPTEQGQEPSTPRPTINLLDDDEPVAEDPIEGKSISETVIIAVAAAGGGVVLLLAWAMFLKFRYRNKRKGGSTSNTKKTSTTNNNFHNNMGNQETAAEIIVPHGNDDVSTIGDPAGVYSGDSTAYERQKRMFDDDYSLNTASLERMIDVQSSQNELPLYSESPSFNQLPVLRETPILHDPGECFDISAPPGKLGVILEEDSDDGVPVVHSIKDESPLVGRVLRGDRLCSIDGVDCTGKTPHEVAKLLKYKENAPSRILTFSRPTTR